jgi:hypothetical protein
MSGKAILGAVPPARTTWKVTRKTFESEGHQRLAASLLQGEGALPAPKQRPVCHEPFNPCKLKNHNVLSPQPVARSGPPEFNLAQGRVKKSAHGLHAVSGTQEGIWSPKVGGLSGHSTGASCSGQCAKHAAETQPVSEACFIAGSCQIKQRHILAVALLGSSNFF